MGWKREKKYSFKFPGQVYEMLSENENQIVLTTHVKALEDSVVMFNTEKRDAQVGNDERLFN